MLKRRRWIISLLIAAALVGVSLAAVARFYPRETLLMERSVSLADTSRWENSHYYWLPDQTLLLLHALPLGIIGNSGGTSYTASRYDMASHQETPLLGLTAALAKDAFSPDGMRLSPDGKWLLWFDYQNPYETNKFSEDELHMKVAAASLDGLHRQEWVLFSSAFPFWLSDSRHWLEVRSDSISKALIHSLEDPKRTQTLAMDPEMPQMDFSRAASGSGNTLLSDTGSWSDQSESDEILALRIGPQSLQPIARHKVTLPPNAEIVNIVYSPQGDRIAWVLNIHSTPAFAAFLRRILPSFSAPPQTALSLWVSRTDGSEMHEIGHLPRHTEIDAPQIMVPMKGSPPKAVVVDTGNLNQETTVTDWQWMPDGKRISFLYKNMLYAVPVE